MRINIAASHRFHLMDLARELSNLGHDVRFYSYVPTRRAIKYGLKKECSYSLFLLMLPFLALNKLTKMAYWSVKINHLVLDYYLSWFMKPCDVYIALGTVYKKSITSAKQKYDAITILEWGSKHIEDQQEILAKISAVRKQPQYFTDRSLQGYELADYIAIPSDHVKQSFIARGIPQQKLLQNPYGVDLSMFKPTKSIGKKHYDMIFVGAWCYRKGCDLLIEVCKKRELTLLHVGSISDLNFPAYTNMIHIDSVDQSTLFNYYSKAKIFVLPSREEGLAMVQSQALACGLPIVCSQHTGGRDLSKYLTDKQWIIEMQTYTVEELERCIDNALQLATKQREARSRFKDIQDHLSWSAYAKRYHNTVERIHSDCKGR